MKSIFNNDDKRSLLICFLIFMAIIIIIGFIYLLVIFCPEREIEDFYQDCIYRCPTDSHGDYTNLECPEMCRELLGCDFVNSGDGEK